MRGSCETITRVKLWVFPVVLCALIAAGSGCGSSVSTDSGAAPASSSTIDGSWRIRFHDRADSLPDVEKPIDIQQDGETVTFVFANGARLGGTLFDKTLFIRGEAMDGEVKMIETYRGLVSDDGREIRGEVSDLNTSTGHADECKFHMVRR